VNATFDLITTHCAGAAYGAFNTRLDELTFGTKLVAVRELGNEYDKNAIRLDTQDGRKVGYVPAVQAAWMKNLIDQGGYALTAEVDSVEAHRKLVVITIKMPKATRP